MALQRAIRAWALRRAAVIAGVLGRRTAARACWQRLRALSPDDAGVVESLAWLDAERGDRAGAAALFEQAVALDPRRAGAWFNLGFVRQEAGDHAGALDTFDHAIAIDPRLDRPHYGRALSLLRTGRVADAIGALRRNTELQPMSPYGWYQLAHAYHRAGDDERAREVMRTLSRFEPRVAKQLERETGIDAGIQVPF